MNTVINERQDMQSIEEINSIIADVRRKLDNNDYQVMTISDYVKPVQFIAIKLNDLYIYLTPIKTSVEGYFFHKDYKDFKAPYVLVNNSKFKKNRIEFDENAMSHELQHYVDYKKGNKFTNTKEILKPEGGINPDYYNEPTELNAYIIQILRQYFQKVPVKKLSTDFQIFYRDFFRKTDARSFYQYLTDDNKKRFQKRIYQFYVKILKKKQEIT